MSVITTTALGSVTIPSPLSQTLIFVPIPGSSIVLAVIGCSSFQVHAVPLTITTASSVVTFGDTRTGIPRIDVMFPFWTNAVATEGNCEPFPTIQFTREVYPTGSSHTTALAAL